MCAEDACPMAGRCARHANYLEARETELSLRLLNTSLLNITTEGCEYIHIPQQVSVARGFMKMHGSVPSGAVRNLWKSFPHCNSRRQFYYMRDGRVPLMPEHQRDILDFFAEHGADMSLGFDSYQEVTV